MQKLLLVLVGFILGSTTFYFTFYRQHIDEREERIWQLIDSVDYYSSLFERVLVSCEDVIIDNIVLGSKNRRLIIKNADLTKRCGIK